MGDQAAGGTGAATASAAPIGDGRLGPHQGADDGRRDPPRRDGDDGTGPTQLPRGEELQHDGHETEDRVALGGHHPSSVETKRGGDGSGAAPGEQQGRAAARRAAGTESAIGHTVTWTIPGGPPARQPAPRRCGWCRGALADALTAAA